MKQLIALFLIMNTIGCASNVTVKETELTSPNWMLPRKIYEVTCERNATIDNCLFRLEKICGDQKYVLFPLNTYKAFYNMTEKHQVSYVAACIED